MLLATLVLLLLLLLLLLLSRMLPCNCCGCCFLLHLVSFFVVWLFCCSSSVFLVVCWSALCVCFALHHFFLEQEQPVYERCGIFRLQEPAHFSCGKSVATKTAVALECACHLLLHFRAWYPLYISTKRVCDLLFSGPPLVSCSVAEAL